MKKIHVLFCSWLLACGSLAAQKPLFAPADLAQIAEAEAKGHAGKLCAPDRAPTGDYDMKYHRLEWAIDPAKKHIQGRITYYFVPTANFLPILHLDLTDSLTVDVARWHGFPLSFTHAGNVLAIQMHHPLPLGGLDSVSVSYHGAPPTTGFGSFVQDEHAGAPIVWTLSEPYGARDWWPCKQDLGDKVDSIDVLVTCPTGNRAASNGLLVAETPDAATGQTTFHWRHRHPIVAYLVAMAVTNYAQYTDQAELASGPLPILNYVFPEDLAAAQSESPGVVPLLEFFDSLFVPYPFRDEKYGHAQFGWGGGMEHQTMSFMANFGYELMAHELAHQWFGDHITCGSWADIWLNEGFATYLSGLCYERFSPNLYWPIFKKQRIQSITAQPGGSVWVDDTTSVSRIFSGRLSYAKGAMVLNQLRWAVGDAAFFSGIRNYLNDSRLAGNFARTEDLRAHLETASGQPLGWYFDDWIFGQGHPSYQVFWQQTGAKISATILQTQSHPAVSFFEMPVPLRFSDGAGQIFDARLPLAFSGQTFEFDLPFAATAAIFDPSLWLISKDNTVTNGAVGTAETGVSAAQVFPNPTSGRATVTTADGQIFRSARLFDGLGRTVQTFENQSVASLDLDLTGLPAGTYLVEIATKDAALQRALVVKTW